MNPVKAGIVKQPNQYKYSSYHQIIKKKFDIISIEILKDIFQTDNYSKEVLNLKDEEIEIMDLDREEENFKIAVNNYLKENKINIKNVTESKTIIKEFCNYMKIKGYKQVQIAKLFNMSESVISKIVNSN